MDKIKMTPEEVFLFWKTEVKELGKARFTASERKENLSLLCDLFAQYQVDIDDARLYKKKVVEFLTTEEGRKGNGRYKGWKETAEEEFVGFLITSYQDYFEKVEIDNKPIKYVNKYGGVGYTTSNMLIKAWVRHKFGEEAPESIHLEAHKIGSCLWNMFEQEVMQNESFFKKEYPLWAIKYLQV